jgi:hypothetical protein
MPSPAPSTLLQVFGMPNIISRLDLGYFKYGFSESSLYTLEGALINSKTLKRLALDCTDVDDVVLPRILTSLPSSGIVSLELTPFALVLKDESVRMISDAVVRSTQLRELHLCGYYIAGHHLEVLLRGLRYSNVDVLNLAGSAIMDEGAMILAEAIPNYTHQLSIDCSNNYIGHMGYSAVNRINISCNPP